MAELSRPAAVVGVLRGVGGRVGARDVAARVGLGQDAARTVVGEGGLLTQRGGHRGSVAGRVVAVDRLLAARRGDALQRAEGGVRVDGLAAQRVGGGAELVAGVVGVQRLVAAAVGVAGDVARAVVGPTLGVAERRGCAAGEHVPGAVVRHRRGVAALVGDVDGVQVTVVVVGDALAVRVDALHQHIAGIDVGPDAAVGGGGVRLAAAVPGEVGGPVVLVGLGLDPPGGVVGVHDLAAGRVRVGGQSLVRAVGVGRGLARRIGDRGQQAAVVAVRHRRAVRQARFGQQAGGVQREVGGASRRVLHRGELAGGVRQAQTLSGAIDHRREMTCTVERPLGVVQGGQGVGAAALGQLRRRTGRCGVRAVTRLCEDELRPVVRLVGDLAGRDRQARVEGRGPTAPQQTGRGRVRAVTALQRQRDARSDQLRVRQLLEEHAGRGVDRVGAVRLRVAGADTRLGARDVRRVERLHQRRCGPVWAGAAVGPLHEDPGVVLLAVLQCTAELVRRPPEALVRRVRVGWPPAVAPGPRLQEPARWVSRGLLDLLLDDEVARRVEDVEPHPGVRGGRAGAELQLPADGEVSRVGRRGRRHPSRIRRRRCSARGAAQRILSSRAALRSFCRSRVRFP